MLRRFASLSLATPGNGLASLPWDQDLKAFLADLSVRITDNAHDSLSKDLNSFCKTSSEEITTQYVLLENIRQDTESSMRKCDSKRALLNKALESSNADVENLKNEEKILSEEQEELTNSYKKAFNQLRKKVREDKKNSKVSEDEDGLLPKVFTDLLSKQTESSNNIRNEKQSIIMKEKSKEYHNEIVQELFYEKDAECAQSQGNLIFLERELSSIDSKKQEVYGFCKSVTTYLKKRRADREGILLLMEEVKREMQYNTHVPISFLQVNDLTNRISDLNADIPGSSFNSMASLLQIKDTSGLNASNPAMDSVVALIKKMIGDLEAEANENRSHADRCKYQINSEVRKLDEKSKELEQLKGDLPERKKQLMDLGSGLQKMARVEGLSVPPILMETVESFLQKEILSTVVVKSKSLTTNQDEVVRVSQVEADNLLLRFSQELDSEKVILEEFSDLELKVASALGSTKGGKLVESLQKLESEVRELYVEGNDFQVGVLDLMMKSEAVVAQQNIQQKKQKENGEQGQVPSEQPPKAFMKEMMSFNEEKATIVEHEAKIVRLTKIIAAGQEQLKSLKEECANVKEEEGGKRVVAQEEVKTESAQARIDRMKDEIRSLKTALEVLSAE